MLSTLDIIAGITDNKYKILDTGTIEIKGYDWERNERRSVAESRWLVRIGTERVF